MKQKRFKKLMMSKGYSRNAVNEIVKETQRSGRTYGEVYLISNIDISILTDVFTNALNQLNKVCAALSKSIAAFSKTYNEAMKEGAGND